MPRISRTIVALSFFLLIGTAAFETVHARPASAQAVAICSNASIAQVLGGPRHGSMIRIVGDGCSPTADGWLCLDPDAVYMSREISDRLFALALSLHLANKNVDVVHYTTVHASACNGIYPVVNDLRSR